MLGEARTEISRLVVATTQRVLAKELSELERGPLQRGGRPRTRRSQVTRMSAQAKVAEKLARQFFKLSMEDGAVSPDAGGRRPPVPREAPARRTR